MTESKSCPRCGAGVSAEEAVQGLCAGCLLVAGLGEPEESALPQRPPPPSIGELAPYFPELEILEQIGQGGMGTVYRVRQKRLERDAALKILALDAVASPSFGERFEREARTLASLAHENIVAIYDSGRAGPHYFLLMEYVEGVSLRQMIRAREVDTRTALGLVGQICDALQAAHDRGVVHRDVKPENILVDRRGRVRILDFGLAKLLGQEPRTGTLTEAGQIVGTPRYMAPEQWERPLSVDHRADIYAVGVVFYELLTGELPIGAFRMPSKFGPLDARIDPVVLKTLAKEPERRYQHASDVRNDVQRIASTAAPKSGSASRGWKIALGVLAGLGCLIPLALFPLFWLFGARIDATQQAQRAAFMDQEAQALHARDLALGALSECRVVRAQETEAAGPAPQIERERARALSWSDENMDFGDAVLDLAWHMNLVRVSPTLHEVSADGRTVRLRLETEPARCALEQRVLEQILHSGSAVLVHDGRDGEPARFPGYSFSGPGYSAVADHPGALSWSIRGSELLETEGRARQPAQPALPAGTTLEQLLSLSDFAERPVFGAEPWFVTLRRGPTPTCSVDRGTQHTELDAEALRGTHRYLVHLAEIVAPTQPR